MVGITTGTSLGTQKTERIRWNFGTKVLDLSPNSRTVEGTRHRPLLELDDINCSAGDSTSAPSRSSPERSLAQIWSKSKLGMWKNKIVLERILFGGSE